MTKMMNQPEPFNTPYGVLCRGLKVVSRGFGLMNPATSMRSSGRRRPLLMLCRDDHLLA